MSLSQRNEWIAVGVLILYLAFVPTIPVVRDFLGSGIGKAVGLAAIVYVWKSVSEPVAILLVVALLRSGAIREFADDPSIKPDITQHCESGYELVDKKCKKGDETRAPIECTSSQEWDGVSKCKEKPPPELKSSMPGPEGGTTGAAAATAALSASPAPPGMTVESFTSYEEPAASGGSAFSPL